MTLDRLDCGGSRVHHVRRRMPRPYFGSTYKITTTDSAHNDQIDLQGPIFQRHFIGRRDLAAHVHQIEIAEDAVQHERNRQHHGVIGAAGLRPERYTANRR